MASEDSGQRITRWWRIFEISCLLLALAVIASGCTTKANARAQARAAYLAGRQQGAAAQAATPPVSQEPSVWIVGNVKNPLIPWTADLTLAKAIVTAVYQGVGDPNQILLIRNGLPNFINPKDLLSGRDVPLSPGDRVEIRP